MACRMHLCCVLAGTDPALQEPAWALPGPRSFPSCSLWPQNLCRRAWDSTGLEHSLKESKECLRVQDLLGCWWTSVQSKGCSVWQSFFCILCTQNSPWNKLSLDELQHWKETGSSNLKIGSKHRLIYIKCTWSDWIRAWNELKKVAVTRLLYLLSSRTWCLCLQQKMKKILFFVSMA